MHPLLRFLGDHGYTVLFLFVLIEQAGLPLPAAPLLVGAGALAGIGRLDFSTCVAVGVVGCVLGDSLWYCLGRFRGGSVLRLLCRISLEPDSCVRQTEDVYTKYGPRLLLFAKFVPGLSTIATPMAGMFRLALWRFLLVDITGAFLWAGTFAFLGWVFRSEIDKLLDYMGRMGTWLGLLLGGALALHIGIKYFQRRRFYRKLRIARITPEVLKQRVDNGEELLIVDLRNPVEWPEGFIPGARLIRRDEIEVMVIPDTLEAILYCS